MRMFFYIATVIALIAMYALCRWLTSGRFGLLLVAIRDDENRVRFSGYDPTAFKVLVFAVSGAIAGIAGALYTVQSGIISPQAMSIAFSIEMVIWVAVGGTCHPGGGDPRCCAGEHGPESAQRTLPGRMAVLPGGLVPDCGDRSTGRHHRLGSPPVWRQSLLHVWPIPHRRRLRRR